MTSFRRVLLWATVVVLPVWLGRIAHVAHQPAPPVNVDDIVAMGGRFVWRPDGRVLEYFACGDPNGTVLYAQHGYGSTGLCYHNPHICDIATRLHLRVISITLPGFGLSDPFVDEKRSILDVWPQEVNAVLHHEKISEENAFYVTGESMGCVYGAAVVAATNSSRILGATFFTPPAPDSVLEELGISLPVESRLVKTLLPIPYLGDVVAYAFCYGMSVEDRLKAMPDVAAALTKMEATKHYDGIRTYFVEDLRHSCKHTHHGFQSHLKSMTKDWPIDLSNVMAKGKILVTSAPDDTTNPPLANKWFAKQVPRSKLLHMEPGWGHLHCVFPAVIESVWREMMLAEEEES